MYTICRPLKGQGAVLQRVLAEMQRGLRLASDIHSDTLPKQTAHFAIRNYCGSVYTPWLPWEMGQARQPVAVTVNVLPSFTFPSEGTVDLWTHKTKSCTPSPPPVQATVNDQKLMEPGRCGRQTPKVAAAAWQKRCVPPRVQRSLRLLGAWHYHAGPVARGGRCCWAKVTPPGCRGGAGAWGVLLTAIC